MSGLDALCRLDDQPMVLSIKEVVYACDEESHTPFSEERAFGFDVIGSDLDAF